ncbi:hypothetical protein D9M72_528470 [compost metagenome]
MADTANGISRMAMTWSDLCACMPSFPAGVTAKLARVRQPSPGAPGLWSPAAAAAPTASTSVTRSTPASRFSCSARTSALRLR